MLLSNKKVSKNPVKKTYQLNLEIKSKNNQKKLFFELKDHKNRLILQRIVDFKVDILAAIDRELKRSRINLKEAKIIPKVYCGDFGESVTCWILKIIAQTFKIIQRSPNLKK